MFKKKNFILVLLVSVMVIAVLHGVALFLNLYWTFYWYDIMMHFLGGFWVALLAYWFMYYSGYIPKPISKKYLFVYLITGTLVIGALWEVFEYLLSATDVLAAAYAEDTILDFIMDTIGAIVAYFLVLNKPVTDEPLDVAIDVTKVYTSDSII
jgi:hypothetical protein